MPLRFPLKSGRLRHLPPASVPKIDRIFNYCANVNALQIFLLCHFVLFRTAVETVQFPGVRKMEKAVGPRLSHALSGAWISLSLYIKYTFLLSERVHVDIHVINSVDVVATRVP